jgi:hypothetical protein
MTLEALQLPEKVAMRRVGRGKEDGSARVG